MIYIICGLIGAGKTTYAREHFDHVTDYDEIGSKEKQIEETRRLYEEGEDVAHITCYPTPEEQDFLRTVPAEDVAYLWIATTPAQARKNILKRNRPRDMADIERVIRKNEQISYTAGRSRLPFEDIDIFGSGERW